ncbi:hypothetical protein EXIGLDRAFT_723667 [Exidia glandulosa HHB12029]|uniref:Fungal calcium binding protein domain-containing protein n=1 Tax=Exidia glandulosa HHB12029 TaxID=1314781 RepID=A0A166A0T7_EXIGL|nr:hypothetical protein EXIGLDRAFT_723667 [Exidia glandulosa HHB12029]
MRFFSVVVLAVTSCAAASTSMGGVLNARACDIQGCIAAIEASGILTMPTALPPACLGLTVVSSPGDVEACLAALQAQGMTFQECTDCL